MGEKRRLRSSRTFLAIIGSIFLLIVLAYGWGGQIVMSWKLRQEAKAIPVLALTPQKLPEVRPNTAVGTKLSDAGFSFEVPWDDLDAQKTKFVNQMAVYPFRSGRVLMFFGPSLTHEDLMSTVQKTSVGTPLSAVFGPEATKSNYNFRKTMLELTPSRMTPWMDQSDAIRTSMLLMIKAISSVGGETGIFSIEANNWKGFQFDDPARRPKQITLELYDDQDRHIEVIFRAPRDAAGAISQADVNRVFWTLTPADTLLPKAELNQAKQRTQKR